MDKSKVSKTDKTAARAQKPAAKKGTPRKDSVVIDLTDIDAISKLPNSACGRVNRAILALPDPERLEFIKRYLKGLPRLVREVGSTSAQAQIRPCHGAFVSLLRGVADLVDDYKAAADFFMSLSPEYAPNEYLSLMLFRRSEFTEKKPFNPDDVNVGFFRIRRSKAKILKNYEETHFRVHDISDSLRELVLGRR